MSDLIWDLTVNPEILDPVSDGPCSAGTVLLNHQNRHKSMSPGEPSCSPQLAIGLIVLITGTKSELQEMAWRLHGAQRD